MPSISVFEASDNKSIHSEKKKKRRKLVSFNRNNIWKTARLKLGLKGKSKSNATSINKRKGGWSKLKGKMNFKEETKK